MAPQYIPNKLGKKPVEVRDTLSAVPREAANLEAEGGESVLILNKQGGPAHYNIRGNRHFEGGVALAVPPESFIFSDTRSMRIKDEVLLAEFGLPEKKGGYTPAEIAKRYDINTYRKILADPNSDALQTNTAEMVIANYNVKLGKLAMIQESMKGFPGGIATASMPYMAKYNLDPAMFLPRDMNPQPEGAPQPGQEEMMAMQQGAMASQQSEMMAPQMPMARHGGQMNQLRQYQPGGQTDPNQDVYNPRMERRMQRRAQRNAEREYYNDYYTQLLEQMRNQPTDAVNNNRGPRPDASTGIYLRTDANGNTYYEDGRGVRIDNIGNTSTTTSQNYTLQEGEKLITKNGKQYIVKKVTKPAVADKTKIKSKAEATGKGDVYEEDGKYYRVEGYDPSKILRSTESTGIANYPGGDVQLASDKAKADAILTRLEGKGFAKKKGNGWDIRPGARKEMNTSEKEFLTEFFSRGNTPGTIGLGVDGYNVTNQGEENGFYGYTNPDFYEYRYYKAVNPNATAAEWDALDPKVKEKNRREYLYALGFDTLDPHIANNISDPSKLYTKDFVEGKKKVKLNREIDYTDTAGKTQKVKELGLAGAVESFFDPGLFRTGKPVDNQLGLEHADAFTFDRKANLLEDTVEETERLLDPSIQQAKSPDYTKGDEYTPFWLQDRLRNANAAQNYFNINKYYPSLQTMSPSIPNVTYYNPEQENYANLSAARGAMDVARAVSGSSQALGARASETQGKLAEIIGQTMGRYNSLNVNTANEHAYKVADIMNQTQARNKQNIQTYVDQVNTLNQNYDNAKRDAGAKWTEALSDAYTNRSKTQVLNAMYPNYHIDPASGGDMDYMRGRDMIANQNAMLTHNDAQQFADFLRDNPDLAQNYAPALANVWTKGKGSAGMMNPMDAQFYNAYNGMMPGMAEPGVGNNPNYYLDINREGGTVPYSYLVGLL